jgi:hypothetical protein
MTQTDAEDGEVGFGEEKIEIPASRGVPGPGETTMPSGSRSRTSRRSRASLRRTTTSESNSPTYSTRL